MKQLMIFSAKWCGPCQALAMQLNSTELPVDEITKIDVDNEPEKTSAQSIRGVPTLILLQDGVEVKRTTGFQSAAKLVEFCTI